MGNTFSRITVVNAVLLIVMASLLGWGAAGGNVLATDLRMSAWIQQWQGDMPAALEHAGDMLGDTPAAVVAILGGIATAAIARSWPVVVFLVYVGLLRVIGMGLKPIFESPRPTPQGVRVRIVETAEGYGYPSGHGMTAAMIATIIVVLVWNVTKDTRLRVTSLGIAIGFAVLVGWSRIWSGAHWPTDVLGGWTYGVALVLLAWGITMPGAGRRTE